MLKQFEDKILENQLASTCGQLCRPLPYDSRKAGQASTGDLLQLASSDDCQKSNDLTLATFDKSILGTCLPVQEEFNSKLSF